MTISLTNEEKAQIINSHIKSLAFNKYNLEVDLIAENAKASPNSVVITTTNTAIDEIEDQIAALQSELAKYPTE
jgi:flagellar biosynthesis/type III secretory pathway protein FliH